MIGGDEYTIDELARAAGTTVRSVRVYHERGVLPPPKVRGRTGYYGAEHLNRVQTISRLLDRGIKLNGIKELLAAWDRGDDLGAVLGVGPTATDETPDEADTVTATELQDRFAQVPNGLARVVTAGIFEPVDATTYRVNDPELARFVDRLSAAGVPMADILRELERLNTDCDRIARRFVDLLQEHAWEPYARSERAAEDRAVLVERAEVIREVPGRAAASLIDRFIARRVSQEEELSETLPKS